MSYSYQTPAVSSVSVGASTVYESPVIQSTYTPSQTGTISAGVPIEGSTLEGGSLGTDTVIEADRYESAKPAVEDDSATLTVSVPDDAIVTVNGHPTKSAGAVRRFMSRGLKDGYVYTYVVKAVFDVDGIEKTESKSVKLRPGDVERVEFAAPKTVESQPAKPKSADVVTVVKLHVPDTAKVSLAGNATEGTGAVRTFRTKQLKAGQKWEGYTVRVTTIMNGQPISKERTVDVVAGSTTELTFDFDDNSIVSR